MGDGPNKYAITCSRNLPEILYKSNIIDTHNCLDIKGENCKAIFIIFSFAIYIAYKRHESVSYVFIYSAATFFHNPKNGNINFLGKALENRFLSVCFPIISNMVAYFQSCLGIKFGR